MQALQSYPVFEADQVLSNSHLNNLLNYLEQQERLTRIKLTGRGIVCGLEINSSKAAIAISKGCGLSSQGFLVQLCDTNYTDFVSYTPPALPSDLYFLTQCTDENRSGVPFYGEKDLLELIPDTDRETEEKKPLTALKLQDYVVVVFLEASQIDLKNCDTQDCNDKGSRLDFVQRTLLVRKKVYTYIRTLGFNSILLKRFNVPVADMDSAEDILNGFLAITDDATLKSLSENLVRSWARFAPLLGLPAENPLTGLNLIDVKKKFSGNTSQRIFVQYFYDFVDDLLKAYIEFRAKTREVFGECCPEEMDFPLHLNLGAADENTRLGRRDSLRHYFEPSPILDGQGKKAEEAAMLLERLVAMVQAFVADRLPTNEAIAITPSTIGSDYISYRAIPYYYDWARVNPLWYFSRAYNGNERFTLGYRAALQPDAPEPVKNPLLYDIERHNAFRIEGHIGKNYRSALSEVIRQRQRFNLPFDVIALNAIDLSAILNGREIRCHVQDLESDFRVMITGIVCQLQQIIAYVGNLRPKRAIIPDRGIADLASRKNFYISKNLVDMQKSIKSDISKNQPIRLSNADIIKNLALKDVEEGEKLADFVGMDVGLFIVNQKPFYEHIIRQPDLLVIFLQQLAEIVKYLLAVDLHTFEEDSFTKLWTPYSKTVDSLIKESANSENEEIKKYFTAANHELLFKCANEKLFALKDEYLARIEAYHAAVNFDKYFKKHPGMEHKAGVTKGGTFILVYNGETERVLPNFTIPNLNLNLDLVRNTFANLAIKEAQPAIANLTKSATKAPISAIAPISKDIGALSIASKRTEFEFASDLIKELNLGDSAKAVLDALRNRDKEIKERATPIPKGTVIADFYLPYMINSDCPPIAYVIPEEKEPENQGPTADAGADRALEMPADGLATTTLDGSNSKDPEGAALLFSWAQSSGPIAQIVTPNSALTEVRFQSPGVYVFGLTVRDDKGASAQDTVTITVNPRQNSGPIANAGPDQTIPVTFTRPTSTVLDGSTSSDPDGQIQLYMWSQVGGPIAMIQTPTLALTEVLVPSPGVYEFELQVTDDKGATAKDSVRVTVTSRQDLPPIANAGQNQNILIPNPNSPGTVVLDGSASSDPEGSALVFGWIQEIGPVSAQILNPAQAQTEVRGLMPGDYRFGLTVTDNLGNSAKDTVIVTVALRDGGDGPVEKTCGSLDEILKFFESFDKGNTTDQFKRFLEMFQSYGQVKEFFAALRQVAGSSVDAQIKFLRDAMGDGGFEKTLIEWLDRLQNIILESSELRSLALQLYRILALLSMYIVCIQMGDFDRGALPMANVFEVMAGHARQWAALRDSGQLGRLEIQILSRMGNDIAVAIAQTEQNGEVSTKPKYLNLLKKWGEIL
jgi:hypothetical protein